MKTECLNIDGHFYPVSDRRWGACAEELLRYTSRYGIYTQALLRSLGGRQDFDLTGYQAGRLNLAQRALMAQMLALPPVPEVARDVMALVESVIAGETEPEPDLVERYPVTPVQPKEAALVYADRPHDTYPEDVAPLDPFISLASRLHIPYHLDGRRVKVSFRALAKHLDSSNPQVRENLRDAVLYLHERGYMLCNEAETADLDAADPSD